MHYIVGTQLKLPASKSGQQIRPGMTSQQIRANSRGPSGFAEQRQLLTPGKQYTLARILKVDSGVNYIFSSNVGDRVTLPFGSVSEAEKFISSVIGESVPDYSSAYMDQTD
jgi:hypothetical protein